MAPQKGSHRRPEARGRRVRRRRGRRHGGGHAGRGGRRRRRRLLGGSVRGRELRFHGALLSKTLARPGISDNVTKITRTTKKETTETQRSQRRR
ncbi:MAG TPA: hypothetical protein DCM87_00235 [Planctomycetes bacterium]|nr:hypothetical protein [Planctomycetota bacterium]